MALYNRKVIAMQQIQALFVILGIQWQLHFQSKDAYFFT